MNYTLETSFMQERPQVVIVGCGGTGGFVAEALCRLFIGRPASIVLVDHDRVEPHNLLRQNFLPEEVGRFKSEVLAERMARSHNHVIGYSTGRFEKRSRWESPTWENHHPRVIIGCVDNAQARRDMQAYQNEHPRNWLVDAGNGQHWGQVLIGNRAERQHDNGPSFKEDKCLRLPTPALQRPDILTAVDDTPADVDCAAALDLVDQDPTINQMMAMLVVQVVRRMAANNCPWMGLYLDLHQGTVVPRYATPENVAQLTGAGPDELTDHTGQGEHPMDMMNAGDEYDEDYDEDYDEEI